ncbi:MAG: hypothetical protein CBC13_11970 [Planctomycetia bacterium TMED53]|nr:MAG: hypothetical protein CBC13_11970 [Planctomycetia bacterium TMED53]
MRFAYSALIVFWVSFLAGAPVKGQDFGPLNISTTPLPSNLSEFVLDMDRAIELGKALFWDMQAGSDGMTACATCHYSAGADTRNKNQANPGAGGVFDRFGPNHTLIHSDFPLRKLADPDDALSQVLWDSQEVVGSQGIHKQVFNGVSLGLDGADEEDDCSGIPDTTNNILGVNTRQNTGRNAPHAVNAIFYVDAYWDGRARSEFNGVDSNGNGNPNAMIRKVDADGNIIPCGITMDRAALASQSVAPPLSGVEMSGTGRNWHDLGKKMCNVTPLSRQQVSPTDSRLGAYAVPAGDGKGLNISYVEMIQNAFRSEYWNSDALFDSNGAHIGNGTPDGLEQFTLMEQNFSMFWGLAILCYESTLVSNQTRFDEYLAGNENALTPEEENGMDVFYSGGTKCSKCHSGPLLSAATWGELNTDTDVGIGPVVTVETNGTDGYGDKGYFNIGVRPSGEDVGRAAVGDQTWSSLFLSGMTSALPGPIHSDENITGTNKNIGAFKTPTLRNIELTGPFMHNGSQATLLQVVQFYTRGGDFTHMDPNGVHKYINPIGKLDGKLPRQEAVVAFMKALTDERVRWEMAPFDHPELFLPNGHIGTSQAVAEGNVNPGEATDDLILLPMVGAAGRAEINHPPVKGFLQTTTGAPATTTGPIPLGGTNGNPDPITDMICYEQDGKIIVNWTPTTDVSNYILEVDNGGIMGVETFMLPGSQTSFEYNTFRPNTTLYLLTPYYLGMELKSEACFVRQGLTPGTLSYFLRGDVNMDGTLDVGDAIDLLGGIFSGTPIPCEDASDWNDDGQLDVSDPINVLQYLFANGPAPAAPYPNCASDPSFDLLDCAQANICQ